MQATQNSNAGTFIKGITAYTQCSVLREKWGKSA